MMRAFSALLALSLATFLSTSSPGQISATRSDDLLTLTRKIEEQNTKIDALSQQILKLQQEVERGKMSTATTSESTVLPTPPPAGSSTHVVARGETLTSIARLHKVGIDELQKFNHIENDRKLQIGQTLMIPGVQNPAAASPSPSPNE